MNQQRVIKFRAYIKDEGIFPVLRINTNESVVIDWQPQDGEPLLEEFELKEISLMQFTGKTDCNDKEIYEGDLVRACKPGSYLDPKDVYEVRWNNNEVKFCYWDREMNNWLINQQGKSYNIGNNGQGAWCEVVGNIWEEKHD